MKTYFVLACIAIAILCQWSCSPDEEQTQLENPAADDLRTGFNAAPS